MSADSKTSICIHSENLSRFDRAISETYGLRNREIFFDFKFEQQVFWQHVQCSAKTTQWPCTWLSDAITIGKIFHIDQREEKSIILRPNASAAGHGTSSRFVESEYLQLALKCTFKCSGTEGRGGGGYSVQYIL